MLDNNYSLATYGDNYGYLNDAVNDTNSSNFDILELGKKAAACAIASAISSKPKGEYMVECLGPEVSKAVCDLVPEGYEDMCELVVNETQKSIVKTNTTTSTTPDPEAERQKVLNNARTLATDIQQTYKEIDCSKLTDEEKIDISTRLNICQALFRDADMLTEFNNMLASFECDVKKEMSCVEKVEGEKVVVFTPEPQCKSNYFKQWGVPVIVGGGVGIATNMFTKIKATGSFIAGSVAFGITKYLMHRK